MARNGGSAFERHVCKRLSAWWTGDDAASCFWRTAGSGARATVRGRRNLRTAGGHGDIAATDADAQPLTDLIMIELKRGYKGDTLHDLLDRQPRHGCTWEDWVVKARQQSREAGIPWWMVIAHRTSKVPVACMSWELKRSLEGVGAFMEDTPYPSLEIDFYSNKGGETFFLKCMLLDTFLDMVTPDHIRELHKQHRRKVS